LGRWGNKIAHAAQPLVDLRRGLGYAHAMRWLSPGRNESGLVRAGSV